MDASAAILSDHGRTIEAVIDVAEAVCGAEPSTDPARLRRAVAEQLQARELPERVLAMLGTAADAAGVQIQGAPIPAPPYLTVTSRGPVCRGTLAGGGRLVVELVAFGVEQRPRRYVFTDSTPADCLSVTVRDRR